jgi:hypothetical protein
MTRLEDLTKEELLKLIIHKGLHYYIKQTDINYINWLVMSDKGLKMMEEANKETEKYNDLKSLKEVRAYREALDKFRRGNKLSQKADKYFEAFMDDEGE